MKKLIFNGTLGHKQSEYRPMTIEVEKVVELRGKEFKNLMEHTLRDNLHVKAYRNLMYISGETAHCVLFLDADSSDGIIVESEGSDYARKSQFIPNARVLIEYNEFTPMEKHLHGILKGMAEKIAELAHAGYKFFFFEKILGDTDIKSVMLSAVGQLLEQRSDMKSVRIHDLDIAGQPEFTVEPKPAQSLKFYSPIVVEREADYETDWDSSGDLEQLSESEKLRCCTNINEAIRQSFDSKDERRGLMEYYNEHSAVNEKIYSAFPSVENVNGTLMGVLTCEVVGNLTRSEIEEVRSWWSSQCSDGWSDCLEQNGIKTEEFGDIYVHFENTGNAWSIKTEAELKGIAETADTEETESLDIGGISM